MKSILLGATASILVAVGICAPVFAQEVQQYTYDGRGRLVAVDSARTSLDDVSETYSFDDADNRLMVSTSIDDGVLGEGVTFSLTASTLFWDEGEAVTFTINRNGPLEDALSVYFRTVDLTASAADYQQWPGTKFSFASGEASKTLTVAIADDSEVEDEERFRGELYNPSDSSQLGTPYRRTIRIVDNDVASANQSPVAVNDTATGYSCQLLTIYPLANDSDPDGDALTITALDAGSWNASISGDGQSIQMMAPPMGSMTFYYTVEDTAQNSAVGQIDVTINYAANGCNIGDPTDPIGEPAR
ncbi:Calx-beta domain-containing protein [Sphingomicrobium arenosum]|uniref:Calx-beta domain-containing protein n=1 Tax=Sphingomicrobium arenosum TaxID=2233861 RepID=UPI002240F59D|nr:Ig-like domain-containing protein [Sphingomicrobium arenosum]